MPPPPPPPRTPAPARTRFGPGGGPQIPAPGWDPDPEADPRPPAPGAHSDPGPWLGLELGPRPGRGLRPGSRTPDPSSAQDSEPDLCPPQTRPRPPTQIPGLGSDPGPCPAAQWTGSPAQVDPAAVSDFRLCSARDADPRPQIRCRPAPPRPARTPPEVLRGEPEGCLVEALAGLPSTHQSWVRPQSCPPPQPGLWHPGLHETSPGCLLSLVRGQTLGSHYGHVGTCPPGGRAPTPQQETPLGRTL